MTAASGVCPCGKGHIRIYICYRDTDWGIQEERREDEFTCDECRQNYRVIRAGRGVEVIRTADFERALELRAKATREIQTVLHSEPVADAFLKMGSLLKAEPTAAAKYRLSQGMGLVTSTLPTFRKHIKGLSMEKWLGWVVPRDRGDERSVRLLITAFEYLKLDSTSLREALARGDALRSEADAVCVPVMSLGPINILAAWNYRPA